MNMVGGQTRHFGSFRVTMVEAVSNLLEALKKKVSDSEQKRVLRMVADMQSQCVLIDSPQAVLLQADSPQAVIVHADSPQALPMEADSPQAVSVQAPSQGNGLGTTVTIVHQIYGLFGDDKPMSLLFETSHSRWKEVARRMKAHYHLWGASELESLVKQRYPQYWDTYCNVRYPVMRCDIGRVLILHAFGGLYADLDTMPNREWYEQARLAVARVEDPKKQKDGLSAKYFEMEVLVAERGNGILLDWVNHVCKEILSKPYHQAKSFWFNAKMRYIYNTTGPKSMSRFFHRQSNAQELHNLKFLECNHFRGADKLSVDEKKKFDVISYESNSYFTKAHDIEVPVGAGDADLPMKFMLKRIRCKTDTSSVAAPAIDKQVEHPALALPDRHSRDQQANSEDRGRGSSSSHAPLNDVAFDKQWLEEQLQIHRARDNQLKNFFYEHRNSVSTKVVVSQMSEELTDWLIADSLIADGYFDRS